MWYFYFFIVVGVMFIRIKDYNLSWITAFITALLWPLALINSLAEEMDFLDNFRGEEEGEEVDK